MYMVVINMEFNKVKVDCLYCKKEFYLKQWEYDERLKRNKYGLFCSRDCIYSYSKENKLSRNNKGRAKVELIKEELEPIVKDATCFSEVCSAIGRSKGYFMSVVKSFCKDNNIDTSHFVRKKLPPRVSTPIDDIFNNTVYLYSNNLKKRLIKEGIFEEKCYNCGLTEWLGFKIPLELEHINGDRYDNTRENLTLLCPNCHAFTEFYRGRNAGRYKSKVAI